MDIITSNNLLEREPQTLIAKSKDAKLTVFDEQLFDKIVKNGERK
jgi:hypothetical protein